MNRRSRTLGFENLENLTYLSAVHPGVVHAAKAQVQTHAAPHRLPAYIRSLANHARKVGTNVTVTTLVAPGNSVTYEISFQYKGQTYTHDITISAPPTPGPQPG